MRRIKSFLITCFFVCFFSFFFFLLCVAYCCNKQDYDLLPNTRTPTANWFSLLLLLLPLLYRILKTVVFLFFFFSLFLFFFLSHWDWNKLSLSWCRHYWSPPMFTHTVYILPAIMLHQDLLTSTTKSATIEEGTQNMWHFPLSQGNKFNNFQVHNITEKKKNKKIYEVLPICTTTFLSFSSLISFLIHAYLRFPLGNLPVLYIYRLQASKPTLQCAVKQGVCSVNTMQKMPGC